MYGEVCSIAYSEPSLGEEVFSHIKCQVIIFTTGECCDRLSIINQTYKLFAIMVLSDG